MTTDPEGPASQTGPQEGRCGAVKAKDADGNPIRWCRKYPRKGQRRCEDDGGSSPQALAKAERTMLHARAERALIRLGQPVEIDPVDGLLDALYRAHGMVVFIEQQLANLTAGEVVWGRTKETVAQIRSGQWPGTDTTTEDAAAVHLWAQLYAEWLGQQIKAAAECRRAKIDEAIQARIKAVAEEFLPILQRVVVALGRDPFDPATAAIILAALQPGEPLAVTA